MTNFVTCSVYRASARGGVAVSDPALRPRGVLQRRRLRLEPGGAPPRHRRHRPQGVPLEPGRSESGKGPLLVYGFQSLSSLAWTAVSQVDKTSFYQFVNIA